MNTLEEMSVHVRDAGYQYFAICDHSRSAFYANGLSAEQVVEQMQEIDKLNEKLAPFKVFKGIESDILGDGSQMCIRDRFIKCVCLKTGCCSR